MESYPLVQDIASLPGPQPPLSAQPKVSPVDTAFAILAHQLWLCFTVLGPGYLIWLQDDGFLTWVGLPVVFVFGALPILFSAAFCSGLLEMPRAVAMFGGRCSKCAQRG